MFLDLLINSPTFSQKRYEQLVKQRYLISKFTNTSYEDTGNLSHIERALLFKYIEEDLKSQARAKEEAAKKLNGR